MENSEKKMADKKNFMQGWGLIISIVAGVTFLMVVLKTAVDW